MTTTTTTTTPQATQGRWLQFLASLDTPGGHIVVLFVLMMIGWRMFQSDATAGGSIMTLSSGALLSVLNPAKAKTDSTVTTVTDSQKEQKI